MLTNGWLTRGLVAVLAVVPAGLRAQDAGAERYVSPWKTPWSYAGTRGADHWSGLDPAYSACNVGTAQSPIDIRDARKANLPPLRFEYQSAPLRYVINNGHTIRVNYDAPGSGDFLMVGDQRYELTQFHFHRPSEEYVHGKPYDMVVHLMHRAADGQVAGVAVLLKAGSANATIQQVWSHMPAIEGQEKVAGVDINPAGLLPAAAAYYTYLGSQTAPPCTEGVIWFVLKTPVAISAKQIDAFARLYPDNVRPVQPLNGRIVKESQ